MKRMLCVAAAALLVIGCSENTLKVENRSVVNIILNFRAKEYTIPAGGADVTVSEIPNGTYGFSTIYQATSGDMEVTPGDGLSGEYTFERSGTDALLIYGSYAEWDTAADQWSVTVWAQSSTSDPAAAIVGP